MKKETFESLLEEVTGSITSLVRRATDLPSSARTFEALVRSQLATALAEHGIAIDNPEPHPHVFPDILVGEFGVEVKVTDKDSWRTVGNSVFEGRRGKDVRHIYVVFGKMGGTPKVRWAAYEDCVIHVRTSHRPRFEIEMGSKRSLFEQMGISYRDFEAADDEQKMRHVREYARARLKPGERLWWLPDGLEDPGRLLPLEVRLYLNLEQDEKIQLRAEAALLCPQVCKPPRAKGKYNDVATYLLTYHGVLVSQARDLFSAGSVALKSNPARGGLYIVRSLSEIEPEMREAALRLEDRLFLEYWGSVPKPEQRIRHWLSLADQYASGSWIPSKVLFTETD